MAGVVGDVVAGDPGAGPLLDDDPGAVVVGDRVRQVSAGGGGEADAGVRVLLDVDAVAEVAGDGVASDLSGGVLVQVIAPALSVMVLSTIVAEAGPGRCTACAPPVIIRPLRVSPVPSTKKVKDAGPVGGAEASGPATVAVRPPSMVRFVEVRGTNTASSQVPETWRVVPSAATSTASANDSVEQSTLTVAAAAEGERATSTLSAMAGTVSMEDSLRRVIATEVSS